MAGGTVIAAAVEGIVDEAVVRKLIAHAGATPGDVYGRQGKSFLRQRIAGYNNAAQRMPWIVLVDLDLDNDCAPPLRDAWLPQPAPYLCFRVAVRKVEAWLLADAERLASFLRVARSESRRATGGGYLWADIVGAEVETPEGTRLGTVRDLLRAGENDVLVIADESGRERLLPMLESVVKAVDVDAGRIVAVPQEEAG